MDVYCTAYGIHIRKPCLHFTHRHSGLPKLYVSQLTKNHSLMKQQYQFAAEPGLSCSVFFCQWHTKETNSASHSTHWLLGGRVCCVWFALHSKIMSIPLQTKFSTDSVVPNRSSNKLCKKKTSESACVQRCHCHNINS